MKNKKIDEILEFARVAEEVYKNQQGVDLGEVHYCFEGLYGLKGESGMVLPSKESLESVIKSDWSILKDKVFYTSQGDEVISKNDSFMQKPVMFLPWNDHGKVVVVHELSHIGFMKLWHFDYSIDERDDWLQNDEGYNALKIHFTLDEGVGMKIPELEVFSKYYSNEEMQEVRDTQLEYNGSNELSYFNGSLRAWENNIGDKPGRIDFNNGVCFYYVGNNFIQDVWQEKDTLASIVTRLKDNTPSEDEILNPEKYLVRLKI